MTTSGVHRICGALVLLLAAVWVWSAVQAGREIAANRAEFAKKVLPHLEEIKRQLTASIQKTVEDQKKGIVTPLPQFTLIPPDILQEMERRKQQAVNYRVVRLLSMLGFESVLVGWIAFSQIPRFRGKRKWRAPERPAVADAGAALAGHMAVKHVFAAKETAGSRVFLPLAILGLGLAVGVTVALQFDAQHWLMSGIVLLTMQIGSIIAAMFSWRVPTQEIRIDTNRATVEFRHLVFVTSFIWNRSVDCADIPFADIVDAKIVSEMGSTVLELRTTRGKVGIGERIQPFQPLVEILSDVAELNRASPELYRNALAREPAVRTSWYRWISVPLVIAVSAWIFYQTMYK